MLKDWLPARRLLYPERSPRATARIWKVAIINNYSRLGVITHVLSRRLSLARGLLLVTPPCDFLGLLGSLVRAPHPLTKHATDI